VAIIESAKKTFGADTKSDLTVSSSHKSQNWNCYDGNLTKSWLLMWNKTLSGFQRFIQELQPVNGLRVMIFGRWQGCWKLHFCTDCSVEREIHSGAVWLGFFYWDEYQKLGQLSYTSIGYLFILIRLTVYRLQDFEDRLCCWILFLDRTAAERNSIFGSQIGWNFRSPKYHYDRQLSQLSDGP
jgi:hypothetical protein